MTDTHANGITGAPEAGKTSTTANVPEWVFTQHPTDPGQVIRIDRGRPGYYPASISPMSPSLARTVCRAANGPDVSPEMIEAFLAGSMFGWHVPAARLARKG